MNKSNLISKKEKENILFWLKGLQRKNGGFGKNNEQPSISFSYYVFRSLLKLDGIGYIDKKKLIHFVLSTRCSNGGFSNKPGGVPQPRYTSYAIFILKELKALDSGFNDKSWLITLQKDDGGFGPLGNSDSNINYTYYVLRCLSLLGSMDLIDLRKIRKYILGVKSKYLQNIKNNYGNCINMESLKQLIFLVDYAGGK